MPKVPILTAIKELRRSVFTTREIASYSGTTLSNVTQALNHLARKKVLVKISRGIWGLEFSNERISPYSIIPFLLPDKRAYLSFISALNLYGIIGQIPQVITVASSGHTKTIRTKLGVFFIHKISPSFFKGFDWYKGSGSFLIAEPEKAFVDCLYISARRKKQFGFFPELDFPKSFSFKKVQGWAKQIPDKKIRAFVFKKIKEIEQRA